MDSKPPSDPKTPGSGETEASRGEPPLLLALDYISEDQRPHFEKCVDSAGCRMFSAEGSSDATTFIVQGTTDDLGHLRNLLVPIKGLRRVREVLEERLAGVAAPKGLPQLRSELYEKTEVAEEMEVAPGTTLLVSKDFTFDAAHNLPRYNGKCEHLHGHTYRLRVTVKAPLDTWSGMAFDFHDLKKTVKTRIVNLLDHTYLNERIPNPSAEFMAVWIWDQLVDLPLHEIVIWETPTSHITYHGPPKQP